MTNGIYSAGVCATPGTSLVNRVCITNAITVRSVNGPDVTIIFGEGPMGTGAVRCAYLQDGAVLDGFTLSNGHTQTNGTPANQAGGGAFAPNATLTYCILSSNVAIGGGGGAMGTFSNCIFVGNSADEGGGAAWSTLRNCAIVNNSAGRVGGGTSFCEGRNCTLTRNFADGGGGSYNDRMFNCIVYDNEATWNANYVDGSFDYSCTTPMPVGSGNITNNPQLAASYRIAFSSPCWGGGAAGSAEGLDIDNETWNPTPSMGCDEPHSASGALQIVVAASQSPFATDYPARLETTISGVASSNTWDFGDGTSETNRVVVHHAWTTPGDHDVVVRAFNGDLPSGVGATATVTVVDAPVYFVSQSNAAPAAPFSSWSTAATAIQDAVTLAMTNVPGSIVLVSNGMYNAGATVDLGVSSPCRIVVTNAIRVRSVNGPAVTIISGRDGVGTNKMRCAYLTGGAWLDGFTLLNGATPINTGTLRIASGAGCLMPGATLTNCVVVGNNAGYVGGGVLFGTLFNCIIESNGATWGGGAGKSHLYDCLLANNSCVFAGGASDGCIMERCVLTGNTSDSGGGASHSLASECTFAGNVIGGFGAGACSGSSYRCTFVGNTSSDNGGAAAFARLDLCTIVSNSAAQVGGGLYGCTATACVVAYNLGNSGGGVAGGMASNCVIAQNYSTAEGGGMSFGDVYNSIVSGNVAVVQGGGAVGGSLHASFVCDNAASNGGGLYSVVGYSSFITRNSAVNGGGSVAGSLYQCTLSANTASNGGGTYGGNLQNCIVYFNSAANGPNFFGGTYDYSCTTPEPTGEGSITNDPQLISNYRIQQFSPCIGAGSSNFAYEADIDGQPWLSPPAMGCDQWYEYWYGSGYWGWASAITNALTNYDQSATGDGYPNLLKYATTSSATNADLLAQMKLARSGGLIALEFTRSPFATDVTLVVEGAYNLTNGSQWSGIATNIRGSWGGAPNVVETGSDFRVNVRVIDTNPVTAGRYLRLRVAKP